MVPLSSHLPTIYSQITLKIVSILSVSKNHPEVFKEYICSGSSINQPAELESPIPSLIFGTYQTSETILKKINVTLPPPMFTITKSIGFFSVCILWNCGI